MNYLTYGGVTVGLCLLARQLVTWYPGVKALRSNPQGAAADLLPFLVGWSYGCLTTLGVGGLVGLISGAILGISSWLGDVALVWGVGGSFGRMSAGVFIPLTAAGSSLLLILTVAFLAAVKKNRHGGQLKTGAWCGITLGTSAGVAGFAAVPLAEALNVAGGHVYGVFGG